MSKSPNEVKKEYFDRIWCKKPLVHNSTLAAGEHGRIETFRFPCPALLGESVVEWTSGHTNKYKDTRTDGTETVYHITSCHTFSCLTPIFSFTASFVAVILSESSSTSLE